MNAEVKKSNRTEEILKVMHILAWVGFIGVAINGGAILITYIISCYNPEAAENLYKGLDLLALRKTSFGTIHNLLLLLLHNQQ